MCVPLILCFQSLFIDLVVVNKCAYVFCCGAQQRKSAVQCVHDVLWNSLQVLRELVSRVQQADQVHDRSQ